MKEINSNQLDEVLKIFGLSLVVENEIVTITDLKTNTILKTYVIYKDAHEYTYTNDAKELLGMFSFYAENNNEFFKFGIYKNNDVLKLEYLKKIVVKEPHVYEETEIKYGWGDELCINKIIYKREVNEYGVEYAGGTAYSNIQIKSQEVTDRKPGIIRVNTHTPWLMKGSIEDKSGGIWFDKDDITGEIVPISSEVYGIYGYNINVEEVIQLIEQLDNAEDIIKIFCPKVAEQYAKIKASNSR